jgi:predicted glycosyltransferase
MDAESREVVYAERATNVFVHDWIANMDELIGAARAVVCMGGYNTLVEALSLKKPVLAFPDKQLGDQAFQVNALHSKGMLLQGSRLQSQNELTAMMNELPNFRPRHPIDYRGAERSVEILSQMLGVSCSTSSTVDR